MLHHKDANGSPGLLRFVRFSRPNSSQQYEDEFRVHRLFPPLRMTLLLTANAAAGPLEPARCECPAGKRLIWQIPLEEGGLMQHGQDPFQPCLDVVVYSSARNRGPEEGLGRTGRCQLTAGTLHTFSCATPARTATRTRARTPVFRHWRRNTSFVERPGVDIQAVSSALHGGRTEPETHATMRPGNRRESGEQRCPVSHLAVRGIGLSFRSFRAPPSRM